MICDAWKFWSPLSLPFSCWLASSATAAWAKLSGARFRFCLMLCQGKILYVAGSHSSTLGYHLRRDLSLSDKPGAKNLDWLAAFLLALTTKQTESDLSHS